MDEIVGVLDALGDALERGQRADGVACDEGLELLVGDVGIDGHLERRHFSELARQLEGDVFLRRGDGLDPRREARLEGVDDLVDQNLRRRGAGRDAEPARCRRTASQSISAARSISTACGQPARSATSTRRSEFELLGEPTTIMRSQAGAMRFTASWRLVVA